MAVLSSTTKFRGENRMQHVPDQDYDLLLTDGTAGRSLVELAPSGSFLGDKGRHLVVPHVRADFECCVLLAEAVDEQLGALRSLSEYDPEGKEPPLQARLRAIYDQFLDEHAEDFEKA
jgi:hypothetical protein